MTWLCDQTQQPDRLSRWRVDRSLTNSPLKATLRGYNICILHACRQPCHVALPTSLWFSSPHWLLPLPATRKSPSEERGWGGWHIYISLTLPRLRLQSIISSCWTFQMNCIKRVASSKRRERGRRKWRVKGGGAGQHWMNRPH